ncbi:MAG: ribonuclease HII [Actinomycetota bacterium]
MKNKVFKATHRTHCFRTSASGQQMRTRAVPGMRHENELRGSGFELIAGVDEVGVGSWAGPVAVGVVLLKPATRIYKVRDSKSVSGQRRDFLAAHVQRSCLAWSVGIAWPREIDRDGLSAATMTAARRAIDRLGVRPEAYLLDGNWNYLQVERVRTVVRGDSESVSIAAASLVAKVTRDDLMARMSTMYPFYGFESNKGYPSAGHRWALAAFGPCPIHRRLFAPVAALEQEGIPGRLLPCQLSTDFVAEASAWSRRPLVWEPSVVGGLEDVFIMPQAESAPVLGFSSG